MKKKIWLFIAIVLTISFGLVANAFTGNPLSKVIAKQYTKTFLEKTYPNEQFNIEKSFYNFKTGTYDFMISGEKLTNEVEMMRGGLFGQVLHFDGVRDSRMDVLLNRRLNEQASSQLMALFSSGAPHIRAIDFSFFVMKGELPHDTQWEPHLTFVELPHLMILMDATDLTVDQFEREVNFMQKRLAELGVSYQSASVNAQLLDEEAYQLNKLEAENNPDLNLDIDRNDFWYLRYYTSFNQQTKKIRIEEYSH